MQIAVAALLENLLPRVDQMDSYVYNEYKWKARVVSLTRADVTLRILRAVRWFRWRHRHRPERLRDARCNQNYANTMQIPERRDANPRHNIGGNWPAALSRYLSSFLLFLRRL